MLGKMLGSSFGGSVTGSTDLAVGLGLWGGGRNEPILVSPAFSPLVLSSHSIWICREDGDMATLAEVILTLPPSLRASQERPCRGEETLRCS